MNPKFAIQLLLICAFLAACAGPTQMPTATSLPTTTATLTSTPEPTLTPTAMPGEQVLEEIQLVQANLGNENRQSKTLTI